jgi:hypothetical protein
MGGNVAFPQVRRRSLRSLQDGLQAGPGDGLVSHFRSAKPLVSDHYLSFSKSSIGFVKLLTTLDSAR